MTSTTATVVLTTSSFLLTITASATASPTMTTTYKSFFTDLCCVCDAVDKKQELIAQ